MKKTRTAVSLAALVLLATSSSVWAAPALTADAKLTAEGGATFKVPGWRAQRSDASVAVYERAPDKAKKQGFALLVLAIEEGPKTTEGIDWNRVRDNIIAAAKAAGGELKLEVGDAWKGTGALVGRHMSGTTVVRQMTVKVEMIALVSPKVLITVSSVGRSDDSGVGPLANAVAATASVTPAP